MDWDGPDWQEPYSVALIAVPNDESDHSRDFEFTPTQDQQIIKVKIAQNLNLDISVPEDEEYAAYLANLVYASLNGASATAQKPLHATMGHVEPEAEPVLWVGSVPPPGARAKSGPVGDIVFLGTFGMEQINPFADPLCTEGGYCDDWRIVNSGASNVIHLSIGWFTK